MEENEVDMGERTYRDSRKWHVTKEVPLSLIYSVAALLVGALMGYQSLKENVRTQGDAQAALVSALKDTNTELRALSNQFRESAVPSEQAKWRIQQVELQNTELRSTVSGNASAIADINRRLSVMELRNKAARER